MAFCHNAMQRYKKILSLVLKGHIFAPFLANLQNEKYLIDEENMNMKNELDKNNGGGLITENNKRSQINERI